MIKKISFPLTYEGEKCSDNDFEKSKESDTVDQSWLLALTWNIRKLIIKGRIGHYLLLG